MRPLNGGSDYLGKDASKAFENVKTISSPTLVGKDPRDQIAIDNLMVQELDGTVNEWGLCKQQPGANATLAVSLAVCEAGDSANKIPLRKDGLGHDHDRELPLLAEDKLATENNDGPQKISGDVLIDPHRMFFDNSSASDYPVVSIVDPINLKISGDAIKVTLEQKTFEPLKDGYGKFAGSEFPIILIENPFNLWEQKTLETLKDGYHMFARSDYPIIPIWDIFNLWERNIFETFNDGHCLFAESEFPTISIGDPFNLWELSEQKTLETLKDGYRMFSGSEFPIISIGDPFNPTISGDALKVMCESFVSKYPIVSIEDPFDQDDWEHYSKLTCELETKVQKEGDDLMVTNSKGNLGQMLYMAE